MGGMYFIVALVNEQAGQIQGRAAGLRYVTCRSSRSVLRALNDCKWPTAEVGLPTLNDRKLQSGRWGSDRKVGADGTAPVDAGGPVR